MMRRNSKTARIRALCPTTTESMVIGDSGVMTVSLVKSRDAQRLKIGDVPAQRRLDADVQRHMRARTSGAHPCQPDGRRIAFNGNQLDIAAVGIEVRPHAIEHSLNTFPRNHEWLLLKSPDRTGSDTR